MTKNVKAYKPKSVRPYVLLNAEIDTITPNVMSGKVYLDDLPEIGDVVTVRWHHDSIKFVSTHNVVMVDSEKSGDMWLQTYWKGWIGE